MNRLTDPYRAPALDEILEAVLLAAGEPVSLERLESLFDDGLLDTGQPPSRAAIRESLNKLSERLAAGGALELQESASGYQVRIRQRYSPWVSRLWDEKPQRYSRALLETLALIAYRQPVTRGDIEEVRGVAVSSSIMRTLVERGWIRVVGHRDVPGRPAVYATTRAFLDDLGLKTLDSLPPMHALQTLETFEPGIHDPLDDVAAIDDKAERPVPAVDEAAETGADESQASEAQELEAAPEVSESQASSEPPEAKTSATSETFDNDEHAEMASPGESLSFAELEARLAERARQRQEDSRASETDADSHPDATDTDT